MPCFGGGGIRVDPHVLSNERALDVFLSIRRSSTMFKFTEEFTIEPDYLRVTTKGAFAAEELLHFINRVRAEADGVERRRILIDSRELGGSLTEADRFQGGLHIAEVFGGRKKLAWVMPAAQITKLGEMAAVNRGAEFFVSPSESEALAWLLED